MPSSELECSGADCLVYLTPDLFLGAIPIYIFNQVFKSHHKTFKNWMPISFIPIWPEVPRRFPEVLRKDTQGFQNIAKTCRNISILRIPHSGTPRGPSGRQV